MSSFKDQVVNKRIAILGAGMIGLATANRLIELAEEQSLEINIDVLYERSLRETTSDGAGGLFAPDDLSIRGVCDDTKRKWISDSFDYYHRMMMSPQGGKMGFFQLSGYFLNEKDDREKVQLLLLYFKLKIFRFQ
jgi:glycine/D-amino acid oxidase-like deaminating enzyme